MKKIIIILLMIFFVTTANTEAQGVAYKKDIFSTTGISSINVSIEAKSSTDYKFFISCPQYLGTLVNGVYITFNKLQFGNFIDILKKFITWDSIVKTENVQLSKNISSIYFDNSEITVTSRFSTFITYKNFKINKIVFNYDNDLSSSFLYMSFYGSYDESEYVEAWKTTDYGGLIKTREHKTKHYPYGDTGIHLIFSSNDVKEMYYLFTGERFNEIIKEIDEKIGVWDKLN